MHVAEGPLMFPRRLLLVRTYAQFPTAQEPVKLTPKIAKKHQCCETPTMMSSNAALVVLYSLFYVVFVGNAFSLTSGFQNDSCRQPAALKSRVDDHVDDDTSSTADSFHYRIDRRRTLNYGCAAVSTAVASLLVPGNAFAADDGPLAPITHKVFMDIRISRSDGTFYVRDDLPDIQENKVYYGKLILGLYGKTAPTAVERFLSYVNVPYSPLDDDAPLPSYGRSNFKSLDQSTGLLVGGFIPGLETTSIGGGTALQYGGRILPAPLWIDKNTEKLSHDRKGLLSHKFLDPTPVFGITTRSCTELDSSSLVFGQVLLDDSSREFLRKCEDLPTYSMERPKGDPRQDENSKVVQDVAASIFNSQREFFRGAAKTLGDSRADKVYEGKLLRRVEVTQVGMV